MQFFLGRQVIMESFEPYDLSILVFHQDNPVPSFLARIFIFGVAKPNRQRAGFLIIQYLYLTQIDSPSLIVSVG